MIINMDVSEFNKLNVADTCSVWNILSSKLLFSSAKSYGCQFCITKYVLYECLFKPRKSNDSVENELKSRLQNARKANHFNDYNIEISDLQEVNILSKRDSIGKGELSSIVFAQKTRQAFLTDDQRARKLITKIYDTSKAQTTAHLFGWLVFKKILSDNDKDSIIKEHKEFKRPLEEHFEKSYLEALRCRSLTNIK